MARLNPEDIERARTRWDVIAADVVLKRRGRELVGLCVFHNEKTPSFSVNTEKGIFKCFGCGASGTAIDYVMRRRGVSFIDAVTELAGLPPQKPRIPAAAPRKPSGPVADPVEAVRQILAGSEPVTEGTGAFLYLWSRGLIDRWHPHVASGLRAHPALWCAEVKQKLPALIAEIGGPSGTVTALQRIWVASQVCYIDGTGPKDHRAPLEVRKKTVGVMGNGAVRLRAAGAVLGLAEGVETALAAIELFNIPVWATCGAARLGSIAIPKSVDLIVICGDNGEIGHTAARAACRDYARQGIQCDPVFPAPQHNDFNDELLARRAAA